MEDHKKTNTTLYVVVGLFILSLIGNIYLFSSSKKKENNLNTRVDSLVSVRVTLQQELASASNEITSYKGMNSRLDSLVNEANTKISDQETKIKEMIRKEGNVTKLNKKLQAELEELRNLKEEYLEKIDKLIEENSMLKLQNDSLNTTVSSLHEVRTNLEQKVTTASSIRVEYITANAYKKRGSYKYIMTTMAKKTEKINICFKVMPNKIAEKGDKHVYVVINAPDGKTLGNRSQGSKEFKNNETGEQVLYTLDKVVKYTNEEESVCVNYLDNSKNLVPGKYTVEFYVDGNFANKTSFELK